MMKDPILRTPFRLSVCLALLVVWGGFAPICAETPDAKLKVLIVDGQNNHTVWPKSTRMMQHYFEASGRFEVDIARTRYTWQGAKWLPFYPLEDGIEREEVPEPITDPEFIPDFSKYDVIVSNFGWKAADWPEQTQSAFEQYVKNGGGFVTVHAANNCFPQWDAYNRMIGLGGWGGRNEKDGPYVYYDHEGNLVRDYSPGKGGSHGPQHQFIIEAREPDHPILKGMPLRWLHTQDECYDSLRGPAENMTVLATAYSSPDFKGTDRHEPALMVIDYGKGRIFHTILGHEDYSFEGVGFITTLLRGTEWAASGKVTLPVPADFPDEEHARSRPFPCCGNH
jgi:uncharacterized protein